MGLKKGQKQGRDEETQEDYPTFAKNTQQMYIVGYSSCVLLSLPCFCPFFRPILTWNEVLQRLFPLVCVLFWGFLNHLPNRRQTHLLYWRRTLLVWGWMHFAPVTVATSDFQTKLISWWLLLTGSSYHAFVLTSEYAIPTSYICNSVLCWTKRSSSRLSW